MKKENKKEQENKCNNKEQECKSYDKKTSCNECYFSKETSDNTSSSLDMLIKRNEMFKHKTNKYNPFLTQVILTLEKETSKTTDIIISLRDEIVDLKNILSREKKNNVSEEAYIKNSLLKDFLECLDSLFLIRDNLDQDKESIKKGMNATMTQINSKIMAKYEIEIINPNPGDSFSDILHEPFSIEENDKFEEDKIIFVLSRGYKIKDTILKPALVKVNKKNS